MDLPAHSTTDHDPLRQILGAEGLDFLGVAPVPGVQDVGERQAQYRAWLASGSHGTMAFLERHEPGKYDPDFVLEGTRAVVIAGLGYFQDRPGLAEGRGLVARYAWGRDYHKVLLAKLRRAEGELARLWPGHRWRSFTDTAPLDERYWAEQAGASFTARNSLAIRRGAGSWFLLGEILTTLDLPPTRAPSHAQGSCPSGCRRCTHVCPTGALSADGRIEARRCLSYLTIEHRGPIADEFKPALGSWLFGCDLCQEVCPFNLGAPTTREPEFQAWRAGPDLDPADLLDLDEAAFTARFGGSPVHRTGRPGLVRNACLVAANLGRKDLVPRLGALEQDPDPGVADAARWARLRLEATP
jgi:epoxyqueuosine reductase